MKTFFLILIFGFFIAANGQTTLQYRDLINLAEMNKAKSERFLDVVSKEYLKTKRPIFLALRGVGQFFMAKHSGNPFSKISYFKKGKNDMEDAVKAAPNHLEIRFLRYLSQSKMPKILGYHSNIDEDFQFLKNSYKKSKDQELVKEIKRHVE